MLHLLLNCHCTKSLLEVLWNMHPLSGLHIAGNAYGHLNLFNGVSVDIIVNYEQCPYEERCVNLCLLPLSYRREMHDVTLFFKMMRVFNWCDISHYVNVYDDSGISGWGFTNTSTHPYLPFFILHPYSRYM